jgi:LysR family glycine cleavage system transcriptional activator
MRQAPPPIQLLPAFEAAARLESFSKAAQELNVTTSAVSQQIKTLEGLIEAPLFRREGRRTTLTEAGRQYAQTAHKVLDEHRRGYAELVRNQGSPVVRISTTAQIAFDVIIPALPDFQNQHPDIDLRVETSDKVVDFESDRSDAGIRVGFGEWPELNSQLLCKAVGVPVCAPDIHAKIEAAGISETSRSTLIHGRSTSNDWALAAELLGFSLNPQRQLYFENQFAALTAAESSLGIAIGVKPIVNHRLQNGRLKQLFGAAGEVPMGVYLVSPKHSQPSKAHQQAYEWLQQLFSKLAATVK